MTGPVVENDKKSNIPVLRITSTISVPLKYLSLVVLVFQTSFNVLLIRYTRSVQLPDQPIYLSSTAVLLSEVCKYFICLLVLLYQGECTREKLNNMFINWKDSIKLLVPAVLYVIQNNLLYLALTNLDAATYQVTYQLKILTTAMFSILMLNKKLDRMKWLSLLILMIGVTFVQLPDKSGKVSEDKVISIATQIAGLSAILTACVISGFSGVYFEKILKESPISLWMRNLQLAFFSIIFGIFGVLLNDFTRIQENGFFQGYNKLVFSAIFCQSINGLLIGAVVKYADNILKGFATSVSIILSSLISYFLLGDFQPSLFFMIGASGVLLATYLYSLPKPQPKFVPIIPPILTDE